MKRRLTMILACMFLSIGIALAQSHLSGIITSAEDGEPVAGATVKAKGLNAATVSNADGFFSINVPAGTQLEITCLGMQPLTVKAANNMKIVLHSDAQVVDEVLVTAFGSAKKSAFTGSAAVVDSKKLEATQVTSVTNALAGAVPGVQLTSSNGEPGTTSTINIRGFSSLKAKNNPLIIVDGAPYSGDIANLNPSDIASMTVLKDAASNALYGARGANGVIIITTKNAKAGDAKVTFDAKVGWNTRALQHYDVIKSPAQYYETQYKALNNYYLDKGYSAEEAWKMANANVAGPVANGGLGYNVYTLPEGQMLIGQSGRLNPAAKLGRVVSYRGVDYLLTPDDWEDEGTRTGFRQEYNMSVSGASQKSNFYASLGYLNNEGVAYNSNMERLTGRLRADYQVKKWFKIGVNMSFAHFNANSLDASENGKENSSANLWAFTSQIAPIYPLYLRNPDGSIMYDSNNIRMMDFGNGMNAGLSRPFINDANPLQTTILNTNNREGNAASANGYVDIEFIPGLKLTLNGTYNLDETRFKLVYNPYYGQFDSTGGTVMVEHDRSYNYDMQQLLNYTTTFAEKHNLNVMVGHEYYNSLEYDLYGSKHQMFSQSNKELNGAVVDNQNAGSSKSRYNNEGYFSRVQYDYDNRIFASASFRRDASSKFHPDHRWGNFWSLGGAWLINKESWFNAPWVDELKVKASIGSQGNDNIDPYLYTDMFRINNSGGNVGLVFSRKGNENITWETNTNFNIGTEFIIFKRLSGSLEFFHRKTTDMLFAFGVAPSLGYASYYDNVGDLYNSGFEFTLNYNAIRTKKINWDVNFNISTLRNRVTMLHADQKQNIVYDKKGKKYEGYRSDNFFVAEGLSMYTWYIKDYAGVDKETGKSLWYKNVFETDEHGQQKWVGRETTDDYSSADYYVTNKSTIPAFFGGLGTSVSAYGFDLSVNFSFQLGGKGYDSTYAMFMSSPTTQSAGSNFHKDILNSWSPDNVNSNIPRLQLDDINSASMSTRFLTNASYLNIENINLGYTLPSALTRRFQINTLRLYLACDNVAYISARKGFDPRQSFSSASNGTTYAPIRSFSLGMNVTF